MTLLLPNKLPHTYLCDFLSRSANKEKRQADDLIGELKSLRLTPKEAQSHPTIHRARKFVKQAKEIGCKRHAELKIELLAARLGISSSQLNDSSFVTFAEKESLYNYIATYNHTVGFNGKELLLGPDGAQKPWSEVKHLVMDNTKNKTPNTWYSLIAASIARYREKLFVEKKFRQPWYYGQEGLHAPKDMYDWEELAPFKYENPKNWGGGYAYQLCTTVSKHPRFHGDHTFVRICSADGGVYSIGLYRPEKQFTSEYYLFPLRTKRGKMMSPDVSEFWGVEIQQLSVAISKEQFNAMKTWAESMRSKRLRFQTLNDNCTKFAIKMTGFHLNCKYMAPRAIVHHKIVSFCDRNFHKLPYLIQKVCYLGMVVFFNIVSFFGGSFWVEWAMRDEKPHLHRFSHMTSAERLLIESPHKLGAEIIPKVEKWRREKVEDLKRQGASEEAIHQAQWGLPSDEEVC